MSLYWSLMLLSSHRAPSPFLSFPLPFPFFLCLPFPPPLCPLPLSLSLSLSPFLPLSLPLFMSPGLSLPSLSPFLCLSFSSFFPCFSDSLFSTTPHYVLNKIYCLLFSSHRKGSWYNIWNAWCWFFLEKQWNKSKKLSTSIMFLQFPYIN